VPLTCLSLTSEVLELILQRRILERDQDYVPVTVRTLNAEALRFQAAVRGPLAYLIGCTNTPEPTCWTTNHDLPVKLQALTTSPKMTSKTLSTGTLSLKFMQNAHRRREMKEVELDRAEIKDDGKWEVSQAVRDAWGVGTETTLQYAFLNFVELFLKLRIDLQTSMNRHIYPSFSQIKVLLRLMTMHPLIRKRERLVDAFSIKKARMFLKRCEATPCLYFRFLSSS